MPLLHRGKRLNKVRGRRRLPHHKSKDGRIRQRNSQAVNSKEAKVNATPACGLGLLIEFWKKLRARSEGTGFKFQSSYEGTSYAYSRETDDGSETNSIPSAVGSLVNFEENPESSFSRNLHTENQKLAVERVSSAGKNVNQHQEKLHSYSLPNSFTNRKSLSKSGLFQSQSNAPDYANTGSGPTNEQIVRRRKNRARRPGRIIGSESPVKQQLKYRRNRKAQNVVLYPPTTHGEQKGLPPILLYPETLPPPQPKLRSYQKDVTLPENVASVNHDEKRKSYRLSERDISPLENPDIVHRNVSEVDLKDSRIGFHRLRRKGSYFGISSNMLPLQIQKRNRKKSPNSKTSILEVAIPSRSRSNQDDDYVHSEATQHV